MMEDLLSELFIVSDPRIERCKRYPMDYLLLCCLTATLSGKQSWYEVADYVEDYESELVSLYQTLSGKELRDSLPSHDTLNRAISLLDASAFESAYRRWEASLYGTLPGKHICLDGKTMRGVKKLAFDSDCHTISAYSAEDKVSVAQVYVSNKMGEIQGIKELLKQLDITDSLLSIDALGAQTELAETIVAKEGDYLLQVKANQKHSLEEIESFFCPHFAPQTEVFTEEDFGHGRIERRTYRLIVNPLGIESSEILSRWSGLSAIVQVERERTDKKTGHSSRERAHYISSSSDAPSIIQAIRNHCLIENRLHYCLDVHMGQDASRKRQGAVAQIMDLIMKINLHIYQRIKDKTGLSLLRIQKKLANKPPLQLLQLDL